MRGDLAEVAALPMGTFMMATPVILQGEWQIIAGQLRRRRREGEALCFESDEYAGRGENCCNAGQNSDSGSAIICTT